MADTEETNLDETTGDKVFSVGQITLATFIGAPIAGCLLLSHNYLIAGKKKEARLSLAWGGIATALVLLLSSLLPTGFPNGALPFGYCFAMQQTAKRLQGNAIAEALQASASKGSWWMTTGIGIGCLLAIVVIVLGLLILINPE
jgi:hypothetical protein